VIGRLLRVARPDDWTGTLSRVVVGVAFIALVVVVALVRLPPAWVALVADRPWMLRIAMFVAVLLGLAIARTLLISRLPRAAVLFGRTIRFHDGTRRISVAVDEIGALHVEQRPPPLHEVFVLEQRDGAEHDLCPAHWWGAPALHRGLELRVAAAHRRRARAGRRRSNHPSA